MSFVANPMYSAFAGGNLPMRIDVGGNTDATSLFSHCAFTGAGTVTFDTGQVLTGIANQLTVGAIPPGAKVATLGTITGVMLGKME